MEKPQIRIITDGPHTAAFNMAADLFALKQCETMPMLIIRLYSWKRPSITLGIMEKPGQTLDFAAMRQNGVSWIKRPTGGRSVLHHEDLTYSCIYSNTVDFLGNDLMESYRIISNCLMKGLSFSGIECRPHDSPLDNSLAKSQAKLPCFLAPNRHEIMVMGKKLVGSAQKRTASAVLQHGSLPLTSAFRRLPDYLQLTSEERRRQKELLDNKTICIGEIEQSVSDTGLADSLVKGFCDILSLTIRPTSWLDEEVDAIEALAASPEFITKWQT